MKSFKVLHPVNGVLNHDCIRGQYEYEHICSVDARSLEETFRLSQNDFSDRYASLNKRSTSVGDIIIDIIEEKHYFVSGIGFTEIPHTVSSYIDWGNHLTNEDLKNESKLNALETLSLEC